MDEPALGIAMPVEFVRSIDGDTAVVQLRTGQECIVRLQGVDTPKPEEPGFDRANAVSKSLLSNAGRITLWVPLPKAGADERVDIHDISKMFSFERLVGRLFVDGLDLTDFLISHGCGKRIPCDLS